MTRLKKLPRSGHWELDVIPAPELDGGLLVIVDRTTEVVRMVVQVQPDEALEPLVRQAAIEPMGKALPCRPRTLRCRARYQDELRSIAAELDAKLQITDELEAIFAFAAAMAEEPEDLAPALPSDPVLWTAPLAALARSQLWNVVPEAMGFRFVDGPGALAEAFGVVTGHDGEPGGFVLYATSDDLDEFVELVAHDSDDFSAEFLCWCVHLVPAEELPAPLVELAGTMGLLLDGHVLQVFAMDTEGARPLESHEETTCLAAFQALMGAFAQHGAGLEELGLETAVSTVLGSVTLVTTDVDGLPPLILDRELQVTVDGATVAVQGSAEDTRALAEALQGTDGLQLQGVDEAFVGILLWAGDTLLGTLAVTDLPLEVWDAWLTAAEGVVTIHAGAAEVARYPVLFLEPVGLDVGA